MRLAVISDIHANLHTLEQVWEDLRTQAPDTVYCLGDLVGYGAFPNEVIALVRRHEVATLMGNYDEGVGFDLDDCGCAYRSSAERADGDLSLVWSRQHTSSENKRYLRELPPQLRVGNSQVSLLLVHGSPRKINEYVYEDRPRATFERLARLAGADVVLFGHTHRPYQKQVAAVLFVNVGSVGKPHDGDPRACYAVLDLAPDPRIEFRRVAYDVGGAAAAIRQAGLPERFAEILEKGGPPAAQGVHR